MIVESSSLSESSSTFAGEMGGLVRRRYEYKNVSFEMSQINNLFANLLGGGRRCACRRRNRSVVGGAATTTTTRDGRSW